MSKDKIQLNLLDGPYENEISHVSMDDTLCTFNFAGNEQVPIFMLLGS